MPFSFRLEEEREFRHKGVVDFIDNRFDQATGTIMARGVVPNPAKAGERRQFIPGMRARVKIETDTPYRALVVNEEAILSDLRRRFVWVVREGKAERREVKLGDRHDERVEVVEGLREGDVLALTDVDNLVDGMKVTVGGGAG